MTKRPVLKNIVSHIKEQSDTLHILEVTKNLIVIMRKFGRQLSEASISTFVSNHYPEEYQLYQLLWWNSHVKIKDCLLLQQYLREAIWSEFLVVTSSHTDHVDDIKNLSSHTELAIVWEDKNPLLIASSSDKIYRRSLQDDLKKLWL